jgi:hypothetical protein
LPLRWLESHFCRYGWNRFLRCISFDCCFGERSFPIDKAYRIDILSTRWRVVKSLALLVEVSSLASSLLELSQNGRGLLPFCRAVLWLMGTAFQVRFGRVLQCFLIETYNLLLRSISKNVLIEKSLCILTWKLQMLREPLYKSSCSQNRSPSLQSQVKCAALPCSFGDHLL